MVNKELVTRVVDSCYPSPYKIFSVNSIDGFTVVKPLGLFVSLGITSSLNTIKYVSSELNRCLGIYPKIIELESRIINGVYVNRISNEYPMQYESGSYDNSTLLNRDEVLNMINQLKSDLMYDIYDDDKAKVIITKLHKLYKALDKLDKTVGTDWDNHSITVINSDNEFNVSVVNRRINYKQCTENLRGMNLIVHKRVGILVN